MDEGTKAINKKDEERAKFVAMLEQDEIQITTVHSEYNWIHHLNYLYEEKMARPSSQLAFFAFSLVCMALSTGTAFYLCGGKDRFSTGTFAILFILQCGAFPMDINI
jgi:hypothetical protein